MTNEETRKVILSQPKNEALSIAGSNCHDPLQHRMNADVVHRTDRPVVHMHLWNEECVGKIEARLEVRGAPDQPVALQHRFPEEHRQTHEMKTTLAQPIHHALQMRTPLQVRFCNSWQIASDYTIGVTIGERKLLSIRLTGATVATPQPCPEKDCAPVVSHPVHP